MHFIGTLQTNKVKYIVDKVDMIHSLDSEKLAAEIDKQCKKIGKIMNVLCEINCGREEMKSGLMPEDVEEFCMSLEKYTNLKLCGFMTMAPKCEKNDEYIKYFSETAHLVLDIWHKKLDNIYKPVLSMGMSDSFEAAIAAGSTIVRVGRGLFVKE
jgi:pyridoxal phosphate enzyme (YggS family)